jgi:DNA polymerase III delta prime subunit
MTTYEYEVPFPQIDFTVEMASDFEVEIAEREKLKAALAIIGPSGAGKTLGGLILAHGMMKAKYPDLEDDEVWLKVGLVDTEHERGKIYVNRSDLGVKKFRYINFTEPYSPARYDMAVKALKKAGAEVVVIDSISHAWEGSGGLLDMQQQAGGTFSAWNKIKPHIQSFIKTLTQSDIHVISTIRTKIDYVIETSELGKQQIKKVGLKAIQKDDLEYEFQIVFQTDIDHTTKTSKDNSGMFEGKAFKISTEMGENIYRWLEEGIDVKEQERIQLQGIIDRIQELRTMNEETEKYMAEIEKKANRKVSDFPLSFAEKALGLLENKITELGGTE